MAKKDARQAVGLECSVCKTRHYLTQKNTLKTKDKLTLRKYCKRCRKAQQHQEYRLGK